MKVVNNLFWMDEPRPEWHDPELQRRVDEDVQPSGRSATPRKRTWYGTVGRRAAPEKEAAGGRY